MVEYRKITVQSVSFNCFSKPFDWMQKFMVSVPVRDVGVYGDTGSCEKRLAYP